MGGSPAWGLGVRLNILTEKNHCVTNVMQSVGLILWRNDDTS
jgi:hypothetical protein